jgi:hypothetical protein
MLKQFSTFVVDNPLFYYITQSIETQAIMDTYFLGTPDMFKLLMHTALVVSQILPKVGVEVNILTFISYHILGGHIAHVLACWVQEDVMIVIMS